MKIADSNFIVTGGASGLGGATARRIASLGGTVVIADLDQEKGETLADELGDNGIFIKTDVCSEEDAQKVMKHVMDNWGGLHGLINCAGIGNPSRVLEKDGSPGSLNYFAKVIQINLIGTYNMLQQATSVMLTNKGGDSGEKGIVINTASVAAFDGQIGQAAYSASKGGIVSMCLPIARELSRKGIRVMTVAPGIFDTPMLAGLPQEARDSLGAQVPFPSRLGSPDEFAHLVQHIIENQMLNGEVIRLDGAIRMAAK